jgi:hypothetical protein
MDFPASAPFGNSSDLPISNSFAISGEFTPVPEHSGVGAGAIAGAVIGSLLFLAAAVAIAIVVKLRWPHSSDNIDLPTDAGTFERSRLDVPLLAGSGGDTFGLEPDES